MDDCINNYSVIFEAPAIYKLVLIYGNSDESTGDLTCESMRTYEQQPRNSSILEASATLDGCSQTQALPPKCRSTAYATAPRRRHFSYQCALVISWILKSSLRCRSRNIAGAAARARTVETVCATATAAGAGERTTESCRSHRVAFGFGREALAFMPWVPTHAGATWALTKLLRPRRADSYCEHCRKYNAGVGFWIVASVVRKGAALTHGVLYTLYSTSLHCSTIIPATLCRTLRAVLCITLHMYTAVDCIDCVCALRAVPRRAAPRSAVVCLPAVECIFEAK